MNWKSKEIAAALLKKGFQEETGDHRYFRFHRNGKETGIVTKISHGNDEYDHKGSVFASMKKQLHLTTSQLRDLYNCPMEKDEYIRILIALQKIEN